jgi:signal transduction histidine kinase
MKRAVFILFFIISASKLISGATMTPAAIKAREMVKKAVAYYIANGRDASLKAFSDTKGKFRNGEYYLFVFDFDGICLARGDGNTSLIGLKMTELQDPDGKYFIREMLETARDKNSGWVDYKRSNPATKKVESKSSYVEKVDNIWIGCGFYK